MRSTKGALEPGKKYIALDQIQDPANLGAIVRTAEALGISGALLFNCCDVYNPKALRASMGGILRLPFVQSENLAEDIKNINRRAFRFMPRCPMLRHRI